MDTATYLPNELIIQILLRLPVKSLIRFKCVCKSWFSIISSDSHFANSQFQLTASTHTRRALFIETGTPHETGSIDLELSLDDDIVYASLNPPNFLPSKPNSCIEIKGSCRGFILLYYYSSLYLWNPSTGVHKSIPFSSNLDAREEVGYGFGYDHSADDYLVVSISSDRNSSYLEFFSLRANNWKQIDEGTHSHYWNATGDCRQAGSLFNGTIHWFAHCLDLQKKVIVGFDLMEKKILNMHLPDQFDLEIDYHSRLWVFREFLSLWATCYDNHTLEIWVMKEYRVHSSWTKTHVLPTDAIPPSSFFPISYTKSGDIVATDGLTGFAKYNDEGELLGHHFYCYDPYGFDVAMYTESLLSLPDDNVQG
ncbi:F-box/kelch-repeat protein [Trifolium pratense]|uniref:F-box/kelch-repeat protein n=2 Tax=Trifolium pratense TaxID=57577 RepID=A0A2K3PIG4_TRIPR|nr:F-box/kelch-repeat protein At3g23880-like [Trifolium pratense]XP_045806025.1 F-box/kelch-repeat protein At3g23880-like [Trifolium pratense]PNY15045.1 F-box/kelch-repeat protein [Trifolium pratense]CAJ2659240.1 unnamed protein product [Trifolium pratense]